MDANDMKLLGKRMPTEDVISRQAAIDTFHAFAPGIPWDTLDKIFAEIPSAEPEIIRCKDCKHYGIAWLKKDGTDDRRYKNSVCLRGKYAVAHKANWYCADAERRTDGYD